MKEFDLVLLTEERYDKPTVLTPYISNILLDDERLTAALHSLDLKVTRKSWTDKSFNWASAEFALFRTTWDYFNNYEAFKNWLNITQHKTTFINPIELVRWNMDKHYLQDLKNKNIHIVETHFIEKGNKDSLASHCKKIIHTEFILKPAVSGTARHTYKLTEQNLSVHESIFKELISNEAMLLQPFQKNIVEEGEVAMMVIGGRFTHAVLKKVKPGDFRVQDDFGGTLHDYNPSPDEIEFAERAVAACLPLPLYARVDIVTDNQNLPAIMELELIEPEMWFRRNPIAAERLAEVIKKLF